MKIRMDSILNEINNGKNLEVNLTKFSQNLISNYYEHALVGLTMNYFTFYEGVKENETPHIENVSSLTKTIHNIMKNAYLSEFDGEIIKDCVKKLDQCRMEIIQKMQILTTYTDMLQVYEYVLNRLELNYTQNIPHIDIEPTVKEIINYIFDSKDNVIINDKIKDIIGQLPIRITKSKYFAITSNSIDMYKGSNKSSVENYLYILKTSAMLYRSKGMEEEFPNLISLIQEFETIDYKNLNNVTYEAFVSKLNQGAEFVRDMVDIYVELVEIVNNLYVLLLAKPYILKTDESMEQVCKEILFPLNDNLLSNKFDTDLNRLTEKLEVLEGKQEDIGFHIVKLESILYDIKERHTPFINSVMLGTVFDSLYTCQQLLSSSLFTNINDMAMEEVADSDYITKVREEFVDELKEVFHHNNQLVNRAIMANTLNKMPVFFKDSKEIVEYITNSLTSCNDEPEKVASINLIRKLME